MYELPAILAAHEGSGYVVSPAGYGKTHLIAESTARSAGRQLVLTHTYAGANALRRKMRLLGVSDKFYRIDTIASWALRISLSYSGTSGWEIERPDNNEQWAPYTKLARVCSIMNLFVESSAPPMTAFTSMSIKTARSPNTASS